MMLKFKQFITEMQQRKSFFDSSVPVTIVFKTDIQYPILEPQFKRLGWCIGVLEHKSIIWDGEAMKKINKDQITFIEGHEAAHFKLGKKAKEVECDWWSIASCWKKGLKMAAEAGIDVFEERNGVEFDTDDLEGYDEWAKQHRIFAEEFIAECKERDIDLLNALKYPEKYDLYPMKNTLKEAWDIYTQSITTKL